MYQSTKNRAVVDTEVLQTTTLNLEAPQEPTVNPEEPPIEPVGGVLESALPATTADQISHIRALNKQGESVNITKEESQNLILSDDVKTRVQTLAGMDYSLLTEQIVQGEFWLGEDGTKKQVYVRTFKGTTPNNGGHFISAQPIYEKMSIVQGSLIIQEDEGRYIIPLNLGGGWYTEVYISNHTLAIITSAASPRVTNKPYQVTIKYIKL